MKDIKICKDTFRFENDDIVILFVNNELNIMFKNSSNINLIKNSKFMEESIQQIIDHFKK